MSISIIFAAGLIVFFLFLLGVFFNNKEVEANKRSKIETDTIDYDGSGNFGRIPNKKPKNWGNGQNYQTNSSGGMVAWFYKYIY